MGYVEVLIFSLIISYLFYKWAVAKYHILREKGVPHEEPWPLIGNFKFSVIFGKTSVMHSFLEQYNKYKNCKIHGSYNFRDYVIHIRDPEIIKRVGIKDFDHFLNHKTTLDGIDSEVISKSLIFLKDQKWREMRNTLTPAFTGSKMRMMFELVNECCIQGTNFIDVELKDSGGSSIELEMKDFFTRFTNDAIASTAFGMKVNSFEHKDNDFFTFGSSVIGLKGFVVIKAILFGIIPKVMKALRFKLFDQEKIRYFHDLVFDAVKYRQEYNIIRPDMIHLLMEAKRHFKKAKALSDDDQENFTDDDLLAQCLLFFIAGFHSVATCLCFTAHELLENPNAQQRLYEEVLAMERELEGKPLSYDVIMKMKYMDMVVSESLRKWPPSMFIDRVCTADYYKLKDEEENVLFELKKGDAIFIPVMGIHRDPEYFADPEKFDPERFSEENKCKIRSTSYIPFGVGPRSCIGNRLALMETKALLYHLLLKFRIEPAVATSKNLMASIQGFQLMPKELFWMKFISRK